jgi:hypothetical protein
VLRCSSATRSSRARPRTGSTTPRCRRWSRARCAGAGAVAQPQPQRGRGDRRAHHPRRPRPRGVSRAASECLAQERHLAPAHAARQAQRLLRARAAPTPSSSSSRATRPAAAPSRAATARPRPSCPCAARCSTPRPPRWQGARKQGAGRPGHRAGLRHRQGLRPGQAALPAHHPARRRRLRRPPHHHAAAHVLLPPHARADRTAATSTSPSRRCTASTGKETHWAADDPRPRHPEAKINGRAKPEITRFKGLGEMMPKDAVGDDAEPPDPPAAQGRDHRPAPDRPRDERADGQGPLRPLPLHHGPRGRRGGVGCVITLRRLP